MSSSVFIESNSRPATGAEPLDDFGKDVNAASTDSNLVVVYGKNGVSFDPRGIENLIEEKTLSSISVIRLTSPTLSMLEEEEEAEKADELLRKQEGSESEDDTDDSSKIVSATDFEGTDEDNKSDEEVSADDVKSADDDGNSTENGRVVSTGKKSKRTKKKSRKHVVKVQKVQSRPRNERPEIVGLTVEEFYPPENAKEMVKEALSMVFAKLAGVSTIKHTADYEFQLYVIKNDHCYTPFTSPAQMKAKLAEKQAVVGRKIISQNAVTMKQLQMKKRGQVGQHEGDDPQKAQSAKEVSVVKGKKDVKGAKQSDTDDFVEDDDDMHSSTAESDYDFVSEESGESDNDRDSDLDFDVNNRKGRKRKEQRKLKRPQGVKVHSKRPLHGQDESSETTSTLRMKGGKSVGTDVGRVIKTPSTVSTARTQQIVSNTVTKPLSDAIAALPPIPKKQPVVESKVTSGSATHQSPIATTVRRGPIIQVGGATNSTPGLKLQSSPQTVKEIAINKVIASPRRGFTDIGTLLAQTEKPAQPVHGTPTTSARSHAHITSSPSSSSKGFMQLGVETAAKNKLPAQISIQTHQSSSELAAKNKPNVQQPSMSDTHRQPDVQPPQIQPSSTESAAEQIDLLVSIMKGEMQKSIIMEQDRSGHENIPKLVKMLENTERSLGSSESQPHTQVQPEPQISNFATTDDIDIANAPLLEAPEGDEIPDDLLQHVVDLIEDDKTLQEAVEKQVFGDDSSEGISGVGSSSTAQTTATPPPLAPIFQSMPKSTQSTLSHSFEHEPQSKSIIQMTISNVPSTSSFDNGASSIGVSLVNTAQTSKTASPLVRKEPIQIVRGNGRVITLPPIEAPTTRAKRRAQTQPVGIVQQGLNSSTSSAIFNESSLDSSLQSNSSFSIAETSVSEKKAIEPTNRRRVSTGAAIGAAKSTKKSSTAAAKRNTSKATGKTATEPTETDTTVSQDDDDPNKLWCICRQPHNNRFMICCDSCEDWFHGTCVSVTKAMGLEMEQKGIDWTCPKCVKQQEEKKQRKITDMLAPKKATLPASEVSELGSQSQKDETAAASASGANITAQNVETTTACDVIEAMPPSLDSSTSISKETVAKKVQLDVSGFQRSAEQLNKKAMTPTPAITSTQKKQPAAKVGHSPATAAKRHIPTHLQEHKRTAATISKPPHSQQIKVQKSTAVIAENPPSYCIVCKKLARPNSIYCSDDCIRKHAQNALTHFSVKTPDLTTTAVQSKTPVEDSNKKKKAKGLFEDVLSMADRKPKVERVYVFERKSGRVLTGSNAPTTINLKKWLQENQTFEVVQPGSIQAIEIEKKQRQRSSHASSPTVFIKSASNLSTISIATHQSSQSPHPLHTPTKLTPPSTPSQRNESINIQMEATLVPKPVKQLVEQAKMSPTSSRPSTPKQLQKYPQQVSIKPDKTARSESREEVKPKEKGSKQRHSGEGGNKKSTDSVTSSTDPEPIRLNVRRTLKQQLMVRINERNSSSDNGSNDANATKLTPDEVEEFVTETEAEMYNYFNRDTGSKYKAKYRSLMFNIKDRKNQTLFAKINAKLIQPKQLVRMSPEELASQELAQWRENEAKHQLEMIKKSELDLLSCAKNYVLKTHKGEEVIEGKSTDCVNLDLTIPVEDVVSVLNSSAVSSSSVLDESVSGSSASRKDKLHPTDLETSSSYHAGTQNVSLPSAIEKASDEKGRSHGKEKDRDREHIHDREKRHKSKDRHRDKSRSGKRSHSRSRSRSRSREKRHKSSHRDERREKEERDRDRNKDRSREKEREHREHNRDEADRKSSEKKQTSSTTPLVTKVYVGSGKEKHRDSSSGAPKKSITPKLLEPYSLIDQIIESTKTVEEAANLGLEKEMERKKEREKDITRQTTPPLPTPAEPTPAYASADAASSTPTTTPVLIQAQPHDSDQEPTSTVSIATPPHDPYARYSGADSPMSSSTLTPTTIWSGSINMIDVASFQIVLQPVGGNALNLGKLLPDELDVVGRIGPDTVWDYISKIKKSPNKEIVIIRLLPSGESENVDYTILYQYLENRNRLGVINTVSTQIKDFYIYPLGAGKRMPTVLQSVEPADFYVDPYRPDMLVGIIVRVIGKRMSAATPAASTTTTAVSSKFSRKGSEVCSFTPPGSPKRKKRPTSTASKDDEIDIDAIIKAPIAAKIHKPIAAPPAATVDDADEPYSPGDSSGDDAPLLPAKTSSTTDIEEELRRKMEDLNRQIAAQEMEIAGLLNVEPSCFTSNGASTSSKVLANISIPSNLSQILASINSKPEGAQAPQTSTKATPPPPLIGSLGKPSSTNAHEEYNPELVSYEPNVKHTEKSSSSRLAQLSEAELLSLVPDGMIDQAPKPSYPSVESKSRYEEPPPPGV